MSSHTVVSKAQWLQARQQLLEKEKEFTRLGDQLSQQRRDLPWVKVTADYRFEGSRGEQSLTDLFEGRRQLMVYHFMFDPSWEAGCKSCSYVADHFDPMIAHLNQRDVTLAVISKAPLATLQTFRQRMGWQFNWFSSFSNDFNRDYHVSFTEQNKTDNEIYYNYHKTQYFSAEAPGLSVFYRDDNDDIFHSYSTYARGLDSLIGTYRFLDLVPDGRNEADLPFSMGWVNHHDSY